MRKELFIRFIEVLLVALLLNSLVFILVTNTILLRESRSNMQYMLSGLDSILAYEGNVSSAASFLEQSVDKNQERLTIIAVDGTVLMDTGKAQEAIDNHSNREEIQEALRHGTGYSARYSETLHRTMLYVAKLSQDGSCVLRLSRPFAGIQENLLLFLPAVWLSVVISLFVCVVIADRFSHSVSSPLDEIARQMGRMNEKHMDLNFETCKYPEINVIADTTMKMSTDLKEYLAQIERERRIRQEFFSNASHELKTPLTSVRGYAELLESDIITDENTKKDFVERILDETRHMGNLINDILMISKLETREIEVVKTAVDLREILMEAVNTIKPMADERQVLVHAECPPLLFFSNALQMKELFNNLLSNAVKYNRCGGEVWAYAMRKDNGVQIQVRDSGVGISKEHIGRIFERFYRVDKGRSRKMGGTGLGLAIVKHIVNYYGGSIQVRSEVDVGTEFCIFLPESGEKPQ
ncbi:MAG: ATP-binding protein [bacterium]|nr:ATP-binding protein [bacterium]